MHPAGFMTRTIRYQESKAERKREREKIGRLRDQRITPGTKDRYEAALQQVAVFAGVSVPRLLASSGLDDLLSSFIERLWEDGDTKTMASYALASVQYHRPAMKGHLQQSWKLLSLWTKLEQPRRATPMDPQLLLAFAGVLLRWQWVGLAHLTIVGFCGLLRTGEMFQLLRSSVVMPRKLGQPAILFLFNTKTTKRNLLEAEKVIISERTGIDALRYLCQGKRQDEPLVETSSSKFRDLWKDVVQELQLTQFHYLPYSLRRGGATCAYREGMSFDLLMAKGRWRNISTARGYLDQALQEYAALQLPPPSLSKIRAAKNVSKAAKLGRVQGEV
jgi:hypothetical protein